MRISVQEATNKSKSFPYAQKILRYGLSKYLDSVSNSWHFFSLRGTLVHLLHPFSFAHCRFHICRLVNIRCNFTPVLLHSIFFFFLFIFCYLTFPIPIYNNLQNCVNTRQKRNMERRAWRKKKNGMEEENERDPDCCRTYAVRFCWCAFHDSRQHQPYVLNWTLMMTNFLFRMLRPVHFTSITRHVDVHSLSLSLSVTQTQTQTRTHMPSFNIIATLQHKNIICIWI